MLREEPELYEHDDMDMVRGVRFILTFKTVKWRVTSESMLLSFYREYRLSIFM